MSLDYLHASHMGLPGWIRVKVSLKTGLDIYMKLPQSFDIFCLPGVDIGVADIDVAAVPLAAALLAKDLVSDDIMFAITTN